MDILRAVLTSASLLMVGCGDWKIRENPGYDFGLVSNIESAGASTITAAHNAVRAAAEPAPAAPIPLLEYDATVAAFAQAHAQACHYAHSGGPYGENLYASTADSTVTQVVDAWAAEKANYDYAANRCADGKVCGHYTQVVWAQSTKLGCAEADCTENSPFPGVTAWQLWVCNYDPPGNWVGQSPY